jgi:hypothetical protein
MLSGKRLHMAADIALALISMYSKPTIEFSIDAPFGFHSTLKLNSTAGAAPAATAGSAEEAGPGNPPRKAGVASVLPATPRRHSAAQTQKHRSHK